MFSGANAAENRRNNLEQLKLKRAQLASQNKPSASSSANPSTSSPQSHYAAPPSQHRDATISSRFFPPTPAPAAGNILVPNSSPIPLEDPTTKPYQPYGHSHRRDAPSSSSFSTNARPLSRPAFTPDPLSTSSGFVSHSKPAHATARRQWSASETTNHDEGPPRKKINRGISDDILSISGSTPSPEIQRVGQRRNGASIAPDTMSISSDESLPEALHIQAGPSRPRVSSAQSSSKPNSQVVVEPTDMGFTLFKITRAGDPLPRIIAAWEQSGGDEQKANMLMSNSNWPPAKSQPPTPAQNSRTRELDPPKAPPSQRVTDKERGKLSSIYARRTLLEAKAPVTPPPAVKISTSTSTVSSNVMASPMSPALRVPQRKRAKKMVIDSESEFDDSDGDADVNDASASVHEIRALEYLNTSGADALQELTGCSPEQASAIIDLRPFESPDAARSKLAQGKKKSNGLTARMFEDCVRMLQGYGTVDSVLEECERIGSKLRRAIASWSPEEKEKMITENVEDGGLSLVSLNLKHQPPQNYLTTQPALLAPGVTLKEYQLLGVNWLNLLYSSNYSCILADEMGLGKTIQVISFLAYLKQQGKMGPHLIVVPSSTLENWCREFEKFAPSLNIQTYYADKNDRPLLRQSLIDSQRCNTGEPDHWEVLITTYNLAQGDEKDRKFFKKIDWDCCVYDEGHVLKNFQSQRYQTLLKVKADWRLLLTGTPLQNNLQELVSLLNFILPRQFADSIESLRAIFKVKGDTKVTLLSQERISRAKKMMTPFVLPVLIEMQVLKDLPKKTERIEWCEMTDLQRSIYRNALHRSRKTIVEAADEADDGLPARPTKKLKAAAKPKVTSYSENSSNVLMDLRKAASHPMLFRTLFTDDALTGITKQLLKEPDFKRRGALFELVKEDMSVMTDSELQLFCGTYKSTKKYLQDKACYVDAGKVQVLLKLLSDYEGQGRKFTQILDILQAVLKHRDTKYLLLTGSTPVDVRQTLVDEFTDDPSIPIFLLSTKAGGMGINLTAASVVIMFDQDFNPHNDRQAQDRAYRIGQKRDVEVVKLISKGTIEEDMLRLGETKLALDEAVAGDDEKEESAPERAMKTSLMKVLRQQFEKEEDGVGSAPKVKT
ncbi:hypothetical protein D9619_001754 [Psilocybe cf. subviscida]|uniref:DNA helicase n=1 Tax=Psilocybe cf. subviscida TaxID=2480587 RepID=A0A8H5F2G9_9AGAR|nr:hypothetical protein D9619_001754 [Psilocybe cf. subviscida]